MSSEDKPLLGSYTTAILIPDDKLNCKKRSLSYEQHKLSDIVQGWGKLYVKSKSFSPLTVVEPLHIFLSGNVSCGKSSLMEVMH